MSDLIDDYCKRGLVSDPTRHFVCCDVCDFACHPDDMTEADELTYSGEHITLNICADCCADQKARE